ncbi:MAG: hypothetical protein NTX03_07000 [Bacteroidetes bacterium]|nr:hypothetical protein [Bacteroidota bacterium]
MNELLGIGSRVRHTDFGEGVVINVSSATYLITFMKGGKKEISHNYSLEIIDAEDAADDLISLYDIERSLTRVLQKWGEIGEIVPLGQKWIGGKMVLQPASNDLKGKEIPIDIFFHKIVMIRDRMRTLEQRVNASALTDEEKVSIQQYITKCYGSLTSFNVLFKRPEDYFSGEGA